MTIAVQAQSVNPSKPHPLAKIWYGLSAPFQRLWWHTHAYTVIFGVMALTILSVVVLYLYDQLSKVVSFLYRGFHSSTNQVPEISTSTKQRNY